MQDIPEEHITQRTSPTGLYLALGISLGLCLGMLLGLLTSSVGVGIGMGLAVGVAIGMGLDQLHVHRHKPLEDPALNTFSEEDAP